VFWDKKEEVHDGKKKRKEDNLFGKHAHFSKRN
jgi:hypothetical protein